MPKARLSKKPKRSMSCCCKTEVAKKVTQTRGNGNQRQNVGKRRNGNKIQKKAMVDCPEAPKGRQVKSVMGMLIQWTKTRYLLPPHQKILLAIQ